LARPVDFQAIDAEPVDLVFMLLTPAGEEKAHLAALARVSRLMRDGPRCARMREAGGEVALRAALDAP
jgi:PTS system nitrogen regulatory IIA component